MIVDTVGGPSLQETLATIDISASNFWSPASSVSSVSLHPKYDVRRLVSHFSYRASRLLDTTADDQPSRLSAAQLLPHLWGWEIFAMEKHM